MLLRIEIFLLYSFFLFLPSQLSLHFWPASSFIDGLKIDYLSPTIYLTDIIVTSLLILHFPKISKSNYLFLLLLIPVNIIFSLNPLFSIYKFIKYILFCIFFAYLIENAKLVKKIFLVAFPITLIWVSLLAIFQFLNQGSLGGPLYLLGERPLALSQPNIAKISLAGFGLFLRPYATFSHPNALAGFLFLSFWELIQFKARFSVKIVLGLLLITLLLTFSRSVIFVICLTLCIWFLIKKKTVCFAILLIIFFLSIVFSYNFGSATSLSERQYLFSKSISALMSHPVFGLGYGNFMTYSYFSPVKNPFIIFQPVHNIYLLLLTELGIPSTIILFAITLKLLLKKLFQISLADRLSLLGLVLLGTLDHYWLTSHQVNLFLFVVFSFIIVRSKSNASK